MNDIVHNIKERRFHYLKRLAWQEIEIAQGYKPKIPEYYDFLKEIVNEYDSLIKYCDSFEMKRDDENE